MTKRNIRGYRLNKNGKVILNLLPTEKLLTEYKGIFFKDEDSTYYYLVCMRGKNSFLYNS